MADPVASRQRSCRELAEEMWQWIREESERPCPLADLALVVAHPDDEWVGAGALLPRLCHAWYVYVTDGAPLDPRDSLAAGFTSREAYATARRRERDACLREAGVALDRIVDLGIIDQQAAHQLAQLARALAEQFVSRQVLAVMTHPYEGGHPDHDATAFAVHAASDVLAASGICRPVIIEMASYHLRDGRMHTGAFLMDCEDRLAVTNNLSASQRDGKNRLRAVYESQRSTLSWFSADRECYRLAPRYDFTSPPCDEPLFYEQFPWGMTGDWFRCLAREALQELGLAHP